MTSKVNNAAVRPEIWGGIECTINRVNDNYLDQLALGRVYQKPEYIDQIINLGIKALRFPVLWEKHQPHKKTPFNFHWAKTNLEKLRAAHIEPIVGLVHHGSGPVYTDLLKTDFAFLFADYARKVAEEFPWVTYYTPINEPLTTARFSGLYGHWYPHKNNDVSFVKMLLNELKATVLAMMEIRKINPLAKLVQTEDLSKTYSTDLLAYQAKFENNRRWLSFDILCGKMDQDHPLWNYFMRLGIGEEELRFFIENPCPPDIIGVNYYITSERYLDENIDDYPDHTVGGNSLHNYADVEAVRVEIKESHGLKTLLQELWERYKIPIAITEAHLHCTREEQLRWLKSIYDTAATLSQTGINIISVTAWALLGSFGWNKLLTCSECEYETGAFDISAGYARPTALALLIQQLPEPRGVINDLLVMPGWWNTDNRYFKEKDLNESERPYHKPLIILGKQGTLGRAFSMIASARNVSYVLLGREDVDITDQKSIEKAILTYKPWAIINAAGYVDVDNAEHDDHNCFKVNSFGVKNLAIECENHNVKLMTFSSDLVFDGMQQDPYTESDATNALSVYGRSKVLAESFIECYNPKALIIRTSAFFGSWDNYNFLTVLTRELSLGKQVEAFYDLTISPTYVPHLVNAALNLLMDDASGIWHLSNQGKITWFELAKLVAAQRGFDESLIKPVSAKNAIAKRPSQSVLVSQKYSLMPTLAEGLQEYLDSRSVSVMHL
jgi:dTDP-4-dehydrorhamnose reductase